MSTEPHGIERENQVRDIAARLGVADFVYAGRPVQKGAGQREASGDGLLVVGDSGAILQVKARDPVRGVKDSAERAAAWIRKQGDKAAEQGLGTRRELARRRATGSAVVVYPVRATGMSEDLKERYALEVDFPVDNWPVIVILDHPEMPEVDLGFQNGVIYFTFADWWELQRRLRSTAATLDYVHRVLTDSLHVPLGQEAARYAALRSADELSVAESATAVPYLADMENFDELGADIFHDIMDKIWPHDGFVPWRTTSEYRSIVEFLDRVPPVVQSTVGRWILRKRSEIAQGRRVSSGLIDLDFADRLVFACSHFRHWLSERDWLSEFSLLTCLRHIQALETGALATTVTLGVGVLVEDRGERSGVAYTFLMLKGLAAAIPIPEDLRRNFEWRFGVHDYAAGTTVEPEIHASAPCPCLSGNTFGSCCKT